MQELKLETAELLPSRETLSRHPLRNGRGVRSGPGGRPPFAGGLPSPAPGGYVQGAFTGW